MFNDDVDSSIIEQAIAKAHREAIFRSSIIFVILIVAGFLIVPFIYEYSGRRISPSVAFIVIYAIDFFLMFLVYRYTKNSLFNKYIREYKEKARKR